MASERWTIEMLGGLRVRQGAHAIERFPTLKAASLLALLAYRPERTYPREQLIAEFWPDSEPQAARNSLRQTLHLLRSLLEAQSSLPPLFLSDRTTLQLNSAAFQTDVARFVAHLKAAKTSPTAEEKLEHACHAADLYRGELLSGCYEEWIFPERQRLEAVYLHTLQEIVTALEAADDPRRALPYALRLVQADPMEEEAHCQVVRLYAAAGQTARATAQYQELERILREEFGVEPSAAAQELVRNSLGSGRIARPRRVSAPSASVSDVSPLSWPEVAAPAPFTEAETESARRPPTPLTRFFGREAEIIDLVRRLHDPQTRLLTLTGPGGSGKTRLAIEVLRQVAPIYGNLAFFVPLAALPDACLLPDAVADVLELSRQTPLPLLEQIVRRLSVGRTLLLLDNFETAAEEGAACVLTLLQSVPTLTCLVTSRHRLNIEGEQEFSVAPLPIPPPEVVTPRTSEAQRRAPDLLQEFACVQLFLDRAGAVRPGFRMTPHNAPDLAAICVQLEGTPLAIELAAARIGALSLSQMRAQLQHRLEFLISRRLDLPARHRSLRAAIAWSYCLAPPELQRCFVRLAVFQGGWTLEAAEAAAASGGEDDAQLYPLHSAPDILSLLEQLRERSLIRVEETETGLRFTMLETLREYGRERWTPEEAEEICERHARYFAELFRDPEDAPKSRERSLMLRAELDNFRVALDWLMPRDAEAAAQMAIYASHIFWDLSKYSEARTWLERILAAAPEGAISLQTEARIYLHLSSGSGMQRDTTTAHTYGLKSLKLFEQLNDLSGQRYVLRDMGLFARTSGGYGAALDYFARYRDLAERLGDWLGVANACFETGTVLICQNRLGEAEAFFHESLEHYRALNLWGHGALRDLGGIAFVRGEYTKAVALFREAMVGLADPPAWWMVIYACALAFTDEAQALERGCETVRQELNRELSAHATSDLPFHCLPFLQIACMVQAVLGDADLAARLLGAHVREQHGAYDVPLSTMEQAEVAKCAAAIEPVMGKKGFDAAYAAGLALPWQETIHLILRRLPTD